MFAFRSLPLHGPKSTGMWVGGAPLSGAGCSPLKQDLGSFPKVTIFRQIKMDNHWFFSNW